MFFFFLSPFANGVSQPANLDWLFVGWRMRGKVLYKMGLTRLPGKGRLICLPVAIWTLF